MKIYTYLIQSLIYRSYYTGISVSPFRRLKEHDQGKVKITSKLKPYNLVYFRIHRNYSEARQHEKWLKKKNKSYKYKLAPARYARACPTRQLARLPSSRGSRGHGRRAVAPPMKGGVK